MGILLELIGSLGTLLFSFTKDITEEEIEQNIEFLKKYKWFQKLLDDNKYKKLIKEDLDVCYVIGKFNRDKMGSSSYHNKYKQKIIKVLQRN